jgi:tRNA threonylcarbamoyl adenosine modification protein YeaZ
VLVLALDTATPAVVAGVAELTADGVLVRAQRLVRDARRHGELLVPSLLDACAEAGVALRDAGAVVVGVGPGPFTGLRVGMVTAAALGDALDVPVHGVGTLDAIAHGAGPGPRLAVTDARRREVYWAAYAADGTRTTGPHVDAPAVLRERVAELGAASAAGGSAAESGLPVRGPAEPPVAALVAVAAPALRAGTAPGPLEPLYLRRPDAVEPAARKKVRT